MNPTGFHVMHVTPDTLFSLVKDSRYLNVKENKRKSFTIRAEVFSFSVFAESILVVLPASCLPLVYFILGYFVWSSAL
jgi:hypothetical protein